jgi:hypothetical protein
VQLPVCGTFKRFADTGKGGQSAEQHHTYILSYPRKPIQYTKLRLVANGLAGKEDTMPEITYTQVGDYFLPNIKLKDPPDAEPLSKYGFMRKNFLQDHRPILYSQLLLSEELYPHCREVQRQANARLETMMAQLVERKPPPNRNTDGLAWAAHMNMLKHIAEETIFADLIYE